MMNKKGLLILLILLFCSKLGFSVIEGPYCRKGGDCNYGYLTVNNLSVIGRFFNVTVTNYNVTGTLNVDGNITADNIGIGTDSPRNIFNIEVSGSSANPSPVLVTPVSGEGGVALHFVQSSTSEYSGFSFGSYWDGSQWDILSDTAARILKDPFNGGLTFLAEEGLTVGQALDEADIRMIIEWDGDVGMGTVSPQGALHINRNGRIFNAGDELIVDNSGANHYVLMGGITDFVPPYPTFPAQEGVVLEIGSGTPDLLGLNYYFPLIIFSHQQNVADRIAGSFTFINTNISGTDKRIAQVFSYTDDAPDEGRLEFATFDSGVAAIGLTMDKSGNVGIMNRDPQTTLDVSGGIRIDGGTVPPFPASGAGLEMTYDTNAGGGTGLAYITVYDRDNTRFEDLAISAADITIKSDSAAATGITFQTNGANTRMTILEAGNVGIGTRNPTRKLHVNGTGSTYFQVETSSANEAGMIYVNPEGLGALGLAGANAQIVADSSAGDLAFTVRTGGRILFSADAAFQDSHLAILETGEVGIGTTTPGSALDVIGDVNLSGDVLVGSDEGDHYVYFFNTGSGTKEYLKWNDGEAEFDLSDDLHILGGITVEGFSRFGSDIMTMGPGDHLWLGSTTEALTNFRAYAYGDLFATGQTTLNGTFYVTDGNVGIGTATPAQKLVVVGDTNVTGNFSVSGANGTFYQDVTVLGTLHGGSPVKIAGINISDNLFMLTENRNGSSRFTLENENSGSNASSVISAKNDIGGTMSIGIGSSNFMIGAVDYQNITALFSKSRGKMVFANFFKKAFVWLYNPSDDNDVNNLVEIMRLDEDGLDVTGNITGDNVFIPQYIFSHTNETIPLQSANVWENVTFSQENSDIKYGITHDMTTLNHTFGITKDGIYNLHYDADVEDTSGASTDIDVAGRFIYINGTEIIGSVHEVDIIKKGVEVDLTYPCKAMLNAGDIIIFQFAATDADVHISTHGTLGEHPESASVNIDKVANLP